MSCLKANYYSASNFFIEQLISCFVNKLCTVKIRLSYIIVYMYVVLKSKLLLSLKLFHRAVNKLFCK